MTCRITRWMADEQFKSEYGRVSAIEWLRREVGRLSRGGIPAEIVYDHKGLAALVRKDKNEPEPIPGNDDATE